MTRNHTADHFSFREGGWDGLYTKMRLRPGRATAFVVICSDAMDNYFFSTCISPT